MPLSGRTEKRKPAAFPARLHHLHSPDSIESAVIQDISLRGVRVLTSRRWRAGDHVWIDCSTLHTPQGARVVYCRKHPSGSFVVGLELAAPPTPGPEPD